MQKEPNSNANILPSSAIAAMIPDGGSGSNASWSITVCRQPAVYAKRGECHRAGKPRRRQGKYLTKASFSETQGLDICTRFESA